MALQRTESTLMQFLRAKHPEYYGKALELHDSISGWLAYVPQTFPHYTRHTIEHSDKIIIQLSKLLFQNDELKQPAIDLSGAEAYILCAGAMLHDCGMVASDSEKTRILQSNEWREWVTFGSGAKRLSEISEFRNETGISSAELRHFLADVQLRFLLAEFIRSRHHQRSGNLLTQHHLGLNKFAFEDPVLSRTIADVCIAHGLSQQSLDDSEVYPLVRDVRNEKVNVRLMAILLRLGDLLDLDSDRACPLLLNAASPIPSDSIAHWTQYRRIVHRLTSPEIIELTAECETQDEHRVLADWCSWIQAESEGAARILQPAKRHADWVAPKAIVGSEGTIKIRPSKLATYVPTAWRLQLDESEVIARLIHDAYRDPFAYVRELLQNAFDATRCKLALDTALNSGAQTEVLFLNPKDASDTYAVKIKLTEEKIPSELSNTEESVHVLSIEDSGIGMTRHVIESYFLQIGRSFYQSAEFRRRFAFPPIGKHGIGFLSVFAVSDHITVETHAALEAASNAGSTKLTLTGPRNYLLLERGVRNWPGTTVSIRLRAKVNAGELFDAIENWCRRVEFPILVNLLDKEARIVAERSELFVGRATAFGLSDTHFEVKAYPLSTSRMKGEFYVFSLDENGVPAWNYHSWAKYTYQKSHPLARIPSVPDSLLCVNGINYSSHPPYGKTEACSVRVDYRGVDLTVSLDRGNSFRSYLASVEGIVSLDPSVTPQIVSIIENHLALRLKAGGRNDWGYNQRLMSLFPLESYWKTAPNTVRLFKGGKPQFVCLRDAECEQTVRVVDSVDVQSNFYRNQDERNKAVNAQLRASKRQASATCLLGEDLQLLDNYSRATIFGDRDPVSCRVDRAGNVFLDWKKGGSERDSRRDEVIRLPIKNWSGVGLRLRGPHSDHDNLVVLNTNHPLIAWLKVATALVEEKKGGVSEGGLAALITHVTDTVGYGLQAKVTALAQFLSAWKDIPGLTPAQLPPAIVGQDFSQIRQLRVRGESMIAGEIPVVRSAGGRRRAQVVRIRKEH